MQLSCVNVNYEANYNDIMCTDSHIGDSQCHNLTFCLRKLEMLNVL